MRNRLFIFIALILSLITSVEASSFKTLKWETANGVKVIFYPAMEVPMLDISIAFAAGSAYDDKLFGIAALTGRLLNQGNGNLDANQIAEKLENTGSQLSIQTSRDMTAIALKTLTSEEALKQSIDTLALIIQKPLFKQEAFNREKNQQLTAITQALESPEDVANIEFFKKLYREHPYAHQINGSPETLKKISIWNIREFYNRYFVGNNAVLVLVGAITTEQAHNIANQLTENLPKGKAAQVIPKAPQLPSPETISINFPSSQTMIRLGQVGIDHNNPSYFPLVVGNYILGGGVLVSRLSLEVREKRGLTYGVSSQFMPMPADGPFLITLSTKNNQATNALKVVQETLNVFLAQGPNEEELTAAKQYLTGSFPLSLASNSSIASMLLRIAFYHLPENYLDTYVANIEAVTLADIKTAFDKLINPNHMLFVSVGKNET